MVGGNCDAMTSTERALAALDFRQPDRVPRYDTYWPEFVEPKAGMDVVRLRERYGRRLAMLGGLDNAHILPRGSDAGVVAHVERLLEVGYDGGLVVGGHSIGPDISVQRYELVHRTILDARQP